jgi:hypothetical protein
MRKKQKEKCLTKFNIMRRDTERVRFHLGRGENYMHWQVKDCLGNVYYLDPDKWYLTMEACKLKNVGTAAIKIYEGSNKTVCAWVECESVFATKRPPHDRFNTEVSFNPRTLPYWICEGENVDNEKYVTVRSAGRKLFIDKTEQL